jgi:hypothetical protein
LFNELDHDHSLRFGVGPHRLLVVETAHSERHARDAGELGVLVENARQRPLQDVAVVDARADDDLAVHLDATVQERPQPAQACGAPAVAEHAGAHLGVGRVDRDEQRREPFGQDPFEVRLGEAGEGREVAVQERQAVVVVADIKALAHALGQLVYETELAVVVAGPDPVKKRRVDLHAEWLAAVALHLQRELDPPAAHLQAKAGLVCQ